jgi:hypothetical protein
VPEVGRPVRVLRALREPVRALDRGRLVALRLQVADRRRADEHRHMTIRPSVRSSTPAEPTVAPGLVPDGVKLSAPRGWTR